MMPAAGAARSWTRSHVTVLVGGLVAGAAIRAALLPTDGLRGDLDQFVLWVHGIATGGLANAYDQNLSFPPVMALIWGALAAIEPAFRTVTDGSDAQIRILMKLPATLADLGLALGVAWALRSRPTWALVAGLGIWLHPAVIDVSAWWGQYESIYVLGALVAFLLAANGRPGLAAVALGVAVMTKPQAVPFLVPFGAWYLGRFGVTGALRYGLVGLATIAALWLPFLGAGGPANYLRNLGEYQNDIFAVLSLRAWNPWWIVQSAIGGGDFVGDGNRILGPITFRLVGLAITAVLAAIVFLAVSRRPNAQTLALGLAAIALVAFTALTTMHERYAYPALVFLALLLPDRPTLALWLIAGVAITINLVAAVPPSVELGTLLPIGGVVGVAGSLVMTVIAAALVWLAVAASSRPRQAPTESVTEGDDVPVQVVG